MYKVDENDREQDLKNLVKSYDQATNYSPGPFAKPASSAAAPAPKPSATSAAGASIIGGGSSPRLSQQNANIKSKHQELNNSWKKEIYDFEPKKSKYADLPDPIAQANKVANNLMGLQSAHGDAIVEEISRLKMEVWRNQTEMRGMVEKKIEAKIAQIDRFFLAGNRSIFCVIRSVPCTSVSSF